MDRLWLISYVLLWGLVLLLGFLLLGALRALAVLRWRLDQLIATTPRRLGRDGLRVGSKAPDFTLTRPDGTEVGLHDFAGQPVLLTFLQAACQPCRDVVPELNRVHQKGKVKVIAVNSGEADAVGRWAAETGARFPVLAQNQRDLSRQYQVVASPFAFLINEQGVIRAKGIISNRQHLDFVLASVGQEAPHEAAAPANGRAPDDETH